MNDDAASVRCTPRCLSKHDDLFPCVLTFVVRVRERERERARNTGNGVMMMMMMMMIHGVVKLQNYKIVRVHNYTIMVLRNRRSE